jgi:hypothetical protein
MPDGSTLAMVCRIGETRHMRIEELKPRLERSPFRPFSVRVSSGATYTFTTDRDLAATKDFRVIFYFGPTGYTIIDAESITEISEP